MYLALVVDTEKNNIEDWRTAYTEDQVKEYLYVFSQKYPEAKYVIGTQTTLRPRMNLA